MALTPCTECGAKISDQAKTCPQCGAKPKAKTSTTTKVLGGLFALFVAVMVLSPNHDTSGTSSAPTLTAAQVAAKKASDQRFGAALLVVKAIKASLREPESVQWEDILANDNGDVVCVEYRARNGFGGMNREHVAYAVGKVSQEASAWDKHCAGVSLYDMKKVKYAL